MDYNKTYLLPKSTTYQNDKKGLDDNNIEYELREIKLNNLTLKELTEWFNKSELSLKNFLTQAV